MTSPALPSTSRLRGLAATADTARVRRSLVLLALALTLMIPVAVSGNAYLTLLVSLIAIYLIAVTGLDVVFGYSGQVSLGHAAFYGVGAYSVAILSGLNGWPVSASMLVGCVLAAGLAAVIGWPSVRLVHHFLALVTIGLGEIMRLTFLNASDFTRGFRGIGQIPRPALPGLDTSNSTEFLYLIVVVAIAGIWLKENIGRSWWGRLFNGMRTNARAAEAFGAPLIRARTIAFSVSAVYGALAGGFYASLISYVSPDTFTFAQSTLFFSMVLIGGAGTRFGPLIGVILLTFVAEFGQQFQFGQGLFYGLMIIGVIMFLPRGIVGSLEDLYRDKVRAPARRSGRGVTIVSPEAEGE